MKPAGKTGAAADAVSAAAPPLQPEIRLRGTGEAPTAREGDVTNAAQHRERPWYLLAAGVALTVMALAVAVLLASPAAAPAYEAYQHGGIDDCETCHDMAHTDRPPTSDVCWTCHAGFQIVRSGDVCWTCHTPVQDMSWARSDAACLSTCHLRGAPGHYDVAFTHTTHAGGSSACTSCHSVSESATESGGSAHHTIPAPRLDLVTPAAAAPGATVTLTGAKLSWAALVRFGGVEARFTIVSDTSIVATVPEDAATGRVTVLSGGGLATSPADFIVLRPVAPTVTLWATPSIFALGRRVRLAGLLTPADSGGRRSRSPCSAAWPAAGRPRPPPRARRTPPAPTPGRTGRGSRHVPGARLVPGGSGWVRSGALAARGRLPPVRSSRRILLDQPDSLP